MSQKRIPPQLRLFLDLNPPNETSNRDIINQVEKIGTRHGLSGREKEIVTLYIQGRSRSYIAKELFISENTVRDHIYSTYRKIGIHNKQDLIDKLTDSS